jgi:uncharacterized protein with gpF-like domain
MPRPIRTNKDKILPPIRPNVGLEIAYRKKLLALVDEMANSIVYWLSASYRQNEPLIAQDDLPANALRDAIRKLVKRWNDRFDEASEELAKYFAQSTAQRSDATLRNILKKAGIAVDFKMTRAMRDVVNASVAENVSLIKSIPQQYLTQVEGIVMRGVTTGRDLAQITKDLQDRHGVTRRRAAFIASDQNNKINAAMTRARHLELGLEEAIWVHSGGGKHPRASHLKAGKDKQRYDVKSGWFDPEVGKHISPGELINCKCVSRAVIPGFNS